MSVGASIGCVCWGEASSSQHDALKLDDKHITTICLSDQYEKAHSYDFPRMKALVLLVANRNGARLAKRLKKALLNAIDEPLEIVGVASMSAVPSAFQSLARSFIARSTKEPVLLDWGGVFPEPVSKPLVVRVVRPCGSFFAVPLGDDFEQAVPTLVARLQGVLHSRKCLSCR